MAFLLQILFKTDKEFASVLCFTFAITLILEVLGETNDLLSWWVMGITWRAGNQANMSAVVCVSYL